MARASVEPAKSVPKTPSPFPSDHLLPKLTRENTILSILWRIYQRNRIAQTENLQVFRSFLFCDHSQNSLLPSGRFDSC